MSRYITDEVRKAGRARPNYVPAAVAKDWSKFDEARGSSYGPRTYQHGQTTTSAHSLKEAVHNFLNHGHDAQSAKPVTSRSTLGGIASNHGRFRDIVMNVARGIEKGLFAKKHKEWSQGMRDKAEARGHTMPGGGFPIENTADLARAKHAVGRAKNPAAARAWINRRARALGAAPLGKAMSYLEGSIAKGLMTITHNADGHIIIDHAPAPVAGDKGKNVVEKAYGVEIASLSPKDVEIAKALNMKDGLVWGWASVIEKDGKTIVDHQKDMISETELMKAAHDHVMNHRVGGALHLYVPGPDRTPLKAGDIVESMVFTKALQKALGIDLGKVGWLIGYHITDPHVMKMAEAGTLKAFSIGGSGQREAVNG